LKIMNGVHILVAGTRLPDDLSSRTDISELHKYFWIGEEVLKNSRFTVP